MKERTANMKRMLIVTIKKSHRVDEGRGLLNAD